ncbi:MAG: hypothetical protein DHS20C12_13610 [Pseudohongiella sp.]|nr:MAG: hypothetical protein DHS20C12_13610 [Pseudohongiella sp.]
MKRDVEAFLKSIEKETKRDDCLALVELMEKTSGYEATLHGKIVGFGSYHYKYASGREGDAIVTGFSPRSQNITLYIMPGFSDFQDELDSLGKHKTAKSCLYVNKLADIDENVLRKIVKRSVQIMQKRYDCTST